MLGPGTALVLDGAGQGQQRGLAQDLGHQVGVPTPQPGEDRGLGPLGARAGPFHGGAQSQPGAALTKDLLDQRHVLLVVAPMPTRTALRARCAVAGLPAAQRRRGYPGARGQLGDGQAGRCFVAGDAG